MFIIIAIEDIILIYTLFAILNCSIGAYKQHTNTIDNSDYEITSYFTWFFLWWIFLPRLVRNLFK